MLAVCRRNNNKYHHHNGTFATGTTYPIGSTVCAIGGAVGVAGLAHCVCRLSVGFAAGAMGRKGSKRCIEIKSKNVNQQLPDVAEIVGAVRPSQT